MNYIFQKEWDVYIQILLKRRSCSGVNLWFITFKHRAKEKFSLESAERSRSKEEEAQPDRCSPKSSPVSYKMRPFNETDKSFKLGCTTRFLPEDELFCSWLDKLLTLPDLPVVCAPRHFNLHSPDLFFVSKVCSCVGSACLRLCWLSLTFTNKITPLRRACTTAARWKASQSNANTKSRNNKPVSRSSLFSCFTSGATCSLPRWPLTSDSKGQCELSSADKHTQQFWVYSRSDGT